MACKSISQKTARVLLWISLPILSFSIVLLAMFPTIYHAVLTKKFTLREGSYLTDFWEDIPLPIYQKIYFFNITNSKDFITGNHPLNVTQVGPYTYKSHWVKESPIWNENYTVSYAETRTYIFVPELSNGTEDDEIYTLNAPLIIASNFAKRLPTWEKFVLSILFGVGGENVILKKKIRELTFEGYKDPIIEYAPLINLHLPYEDGKFGWMYGKNSTDDGLVTVFTGVYNTSKCGIINNWDGQEKLNFWKGETCNMVNGTNFEAGPPLKDNSGSYTFFQSMFCRSLTFNYTTDEIHYKMSAKRFRPTYDLLANGTENPDNYCFDVKKERPSGVLDISSCQFGTPVFISFPHFHMADESYLDPVIGLNPNDEEHGSFLDVEPITGLTIYTSLKFQINLDVTKVHGIVQLNNITEGILPIFWVDLNLYINEDVANLLKGQLNNPKIIGYSLLGCLTFISFIVAIIGLVVVSKQHTDDDDEPLLDGT